jgi:hypothetical protein
MLGMQLTSREEETMEYLVERVILISVYAAGILALVLVPRRKRKEAQAVFLFQGMVTWILGLTVVEAGWIEYPVRELSKASSTSFLFEFLIYPVIAAYFNIYYPKGKPWHTQLGWLLLFAGGITLPEFIIEHATRLVVYTGWSWYWTTLSISATLGISRLYHRWFFERKDPSPDGAV